MEAKDFVFPLMLAMALFAACLIFLSSNTSHPRSYGIASQYLLKDYVWEDVEPEIAYFKVQIASNATTRDEAALDNIEKTDKIVHALESAGIDPGRIKMESHMVDAYAAWIDGNGTITKGYFKATTYLEIETRDLRDINESLGSALAAGATCAGPIRWEITQDTWLDTKKKLAKRATLAMEDRSGMDFHNDTAFSWTFEENEIGGGSATSNIRICDYENTISNGEILKLVGAPKIRLTLGPRATIYKE